MPLSLVVKIRILPTDFKEFIELLNRNQVDYMIVGGYAVGLHGYPRFTTGDPEKL